MIKIDMEMPENCHDCLFRAADLDDCYYECIATTKQNMLDDNDSRPEWCPLIEAKNCTFTLWDDDSNTYECSECGLVWMLMEGTPMENQMEFCPQCGRKIEVKE